MAHIRRKFYDLMEAQRSLIATEAVPRIAPLYVIEREIRGRSPDKRREARNARARPLLESMRGWLEASLSKLSRKSNIAAAIHDALARWSALMRYCDDGRVEIDNSAAERALRAVAVGRRNYLFAGSDAGGERAAVFYSLIGTAKRNGLDPEAYLRHVLGCINDHPIHRIEELLPWHIAKHPSHRSRGVSRNAASKDPNAELLPSLAGLLDEGEVTLGILEPAGCVATAADGHNCLAMLVRRNHETLTQLLTRLDHAIGLAITEDIFTDEVNR